MSYDEHEPPIPSRRVPAPEIRVIQITRNEEPEDTTRFEIGAKIPSKHGPAEDQISLYMFGCLIAEGRPDDLVNVLAQGMLVIKKAQQEMTDNRMDDAQPFVGEGWANRVSARQDAYRMSETKTEGIEL